jgi:hypothetical protein
VENFRHPTLPCFSFNLSQKSVPHHGCKLLVLHALRKMELRIGKVLDGRGETRALRAAGYATDRTGVFNREPFCVANDEAPVFDVEPIYDTSFANLDDEASTFDPEPCYSNLDDGPIFDEDPFIDLVFDAAPDFDHAVVTVLNFTNSARATHDHDDFDDQPVFNTELVLDRVDTELAVFHQRPDDLVATHTSVDFDDNPLFDEEPDSEEAELILDQAVVLGANPVPPTTAVDTPFTCSPKCLRLAIHSWKMLVTTPLHEFKGIRLLGCWTRSACCSTYTAWATVVSSSLMILD